MVGKIYRNIIFIQLTISILSLLGSNIDNIIVGKFLSAEELAACGLVAPVIGFASILAGVITTGIKTVCSRSVGAGNRQQANDQISTAAVFSLITFTIICIGCYIGVDAIAHGLAGSAEPQFVQYVKDYMLGYLLVLPSLGVMSLFIYILQMNNKASYCSGAAIIFIVVNILLDLAAVFVFKIGLLGIGLSTSIAYFAMVAVLVVGYFRVNTTLKISFKVFKIRYFLDILKNGATDAITKGTSMVIKMVVNMVVLSTAGTDALAAVTVIVSFASILLAVSKAIAYCTDMTSGMFYGERNLKELKNTVKIFVTYSVIFNVCVAVVVAAMPDILCLLFINANEAAYPMAVSALRWFALCLVFFSIPDCFVYFFLGIKKPVYSYVCAFILNVSLGLFSALLIPFWMVDGAALAYVFGYASVFFLIVIFFSVKNKSHPLKAETYIDVPENFEIEDKYIFEVVPKNQEELLEASKKVTDFAKQFEDNMRNRMALSLAVEELGNNIFEHGIKNKKHHIFEIRIVYDAENKT